MLTANSWKQTQTRTVSVTGYHGLCHKITGEMCISVQRNTLLTVYNYEICQRMWSLCQEIFVQVVHNH